MKYSRYHGLGNDYLVLRERDLDAPLNPDRVIAICHRHFGVGSDGIVLIGESGTKGIPVRIFNPDGSEAETSGNGMRIAARALYDAGIVSKERFEMIAKGNRTISAQIHDPIAHIQVDIGVASFVRSEIPATGNLPEVLGEELEVAGETVVVNCVNVGNPHCVVLGSSACKEDVLRLGPCLENHPMFPQRINVQCARVINRGEIEVEIWERGAGYTMASGSSASAVASVAHKLGVVDCEVTVHMPGGDLAISIDEQFQIQLAGPVVKICSGEIDPEMFHRGVQV